MLQSIREHTQGWIAGTIISLIILSFALWGIHSYVGGGGDTGVVATVDGVDVTREQLTQAYERLRRQAQAQYGVPVTGKDENVLKDRALKALIDVEVLKQAALSSGFRISDEQIDNYLKAMPEFQVDGQFSLERFQEILSTTLMSTSDFLDLVRTSLLIEQPRSGVLSTSFALPDETNYTIALVNQERDISYINVPLSYFLAQPIVISEAQLKAYYDAHQNDFMTPEQMNVEYIQLSPKDLMSRFVPTDATLKSFYSENINAYTQPTVWTLDSVTVPMSATATQEELTQAQSKAAQIAAALKKGDKSTKITKHYDAVTLNQVPAEWQKAVAGMITKNEVSEPIKTESGLVVLKLLEYREPKTQSFDTVKAKVKETYIRQHAEEKFAEMRDQLADMTYEHPESLASASQALGLPIQTSELFTKDKTGKDISQYKKVRDTAFSNDVMNLQNNSDVIQLNPETVIVLRMKSHIASTLLPLKDVSKQIEDKLKSAEAEVRAERFAADTLAKLRAGVDPAQLAATQHLTWKQAGFTGRYSTKVDTAILETAFSLANPALKNAKATYGSTRLPNGYAIIAVLAVKDGIASDDKQNAVFAEQVQNSQGTLEYELYKLSQTKQAKIKIS
jgi:peptidyl-prolyl cis-trans isomerase D